MNTRRYANSSVVKIAQPDGSTRFTIVPSTPTPYWVFDFTFYQVSSADRMDKIAFHIYGDGSMWWHIADANPEILDWWDVPAGTILRIPRV